MSFDSINAYLDGVTTTQATHIDSIATHDKRVTSKKGVMDYYKFDNLKININSSGKMYVIGSPAKFYNGNNIKPILFDDYGYAIEYISDQLKVPFHEATLTRIDFGVNFVMDQNPFLYQNCILNAHRLERVIRKDTLYLENGLRQLAFYNKYIEAIKSNMTIPESYNFETLFRYESRLLKKKKIRSSLKISNPTVGLLSEPKFTERMIKYYIDEFNKIKFKSESLNISSIKSVKDAYQFYFAKLISQENPQELIEFQSSLKRNDQFGHENYHNRLKNMFNNLHDKYNDSSPLIDELTHKVESVQEILA